MKSRARVGATLVAVATTATAALLLSAPAQAAPGAGQAATRTTLSASPSTIAFGAPAKLKATVKPVVGTAKPSGTVTFSEEGTVLGTVSLALVGTVQTARLDVNGLAIGDHTFTATYNGSATFAASTSLPFVVTVGPAASVTTLTIGGGTTSFGLGKQVPLKASVKAKVAGTGTPAGSVTFNEGATVLGTVALTASGTPTVYSATLKITTLTVGSHIITATFVPSGGSLAGSTSSAKTVTITKIATSLALSTKVSADGLTMTLTASVTPNTATGTVTFAIDALPGQQVTLGNFAKAPLQVQVAALGAGQHSVVLTYSGDATHAASSGTFPFIV
jgi:large repetitive protein